VERFKAFISKFTPYLEDIRSRLYKISILFLSFFAIGFFSASRILKYIVSFFKLEDVVIATTSPFQFADLSINIGIFLAFAVSCPALIYSTYTFLKPAITRKEKRLFFMLIPLTVVLFALGFSYGFFIMYYALVILAKINISIGIQNVWDIGMFLSQIIMTSTLLGVLFQFPIVATFILKTGIVTVDNLRDKRRVAVLIIFIFTSLLPPTDGLSLIAMALPLVLLYEVTIFVNSKFGKQKLLIN